MQADITNQSQGADAGQILLITALPAAAMALGSAAVSMGHPSEQFQARLQHLSAGVLIGAIITEIFPILKKHVTEEFPDGTKRTSGINLLAALAGFSAALVLMYSLKGLDMEGEENGEEDDEEKRRGSAASLASRPSTTASRPSTIASWVGPVGDPQTTTKIRMSLARLQAHVDSLRGLLQSDPVDQEAVDEEIHGLDFLVDSIRRLCRGAEPIDFFNAGRLRKCVDELLRDVSALQQLDVEEPLNIDQQLQVAGATLRQVHSHAEHCTFRRWGSTMTRTTSGGPKETLAPAAGAPAAAASVPWGLIFAVTIDSVVDGMLIGLAGAVARKSGELMAVATAMEMGFLGYSFSCSTMERVHGRKVLLILGVPPLAMLASSTLSSLGATQVEHLPAFCGLVSFALVAVLFLVVQELLIEAHEKEGGREWHISSALYVGLVISIAFDVIL